MLCNVFLVTSTINASVGLISPDDRFLQTVEQLKSIRNHDSSSVIVLVDNSLVQMLPNQEQQIQELVDYYIYVGWRRYPQIFNKLGIIGANESYMLLVGIDLIKTLGIQVKRLFKMSGRRRFSDAFDITIYDDSRFYGKYAFKKTDEYSHKPGVFFLHTRFWSCCGTLLDSAKELIAKSYKSVLLDNMLVEQAMYQNINKLNLIELENLEVEGTLTFWNTLYKD